MAGRWRDTWRRASAMVISRGSKLSALLAGPRELPARSRHDAADAADCTTRCESRVLWRTEGDDNDGHVPSHSGATRSAAAAGALRQLASSRSRPCNVWTTCMRRPRRPPFTTTWKYILCSRVVERMRRALPPIPLAVLVDVDPLTRRCPGWFQKQLKKGAAWIDEFRACNQNPEHSSAWGLPAPPCQNQLMCPPRRDRDASQSAIQPLIGPSLDKLRRWGLAFVAFSIPICPPPVFRPLAKSRDVVHN